MCARCAKSRVSRFTRRTLVLLRTPATATSPLLRRWCAPVRCMNECRSTSIPPPAQLEMLARDGHVASLLHAGVRLHQAGCNGCIGMGQAPATNGLSLRTVPRNFPGRSGTREDKVCLVSPETATASALTGVITDPRALGMPYPHIAD